MTSHAKNQGPSEVLCSAIEPLPPSAWATRAAQKRKHPGCRQLQMPRAVARPCSSSPALPCPLHFFNPQNFGCCLGVGTEQGREWDFAGDSQVPHQTCPYAQAEEDRPPGLAGVFGKSRFSWAMDRICCDYEIEFIKKCYGFHGVQTLELAVCFR